MNAVYKAYAAVRITFVLAIPVGIILGVVGSPVLQATWWWSLWAVVLLIVLQEVTALLLMRSGYWRSVFAVPVERNVPATVFDGDRSFIEILCGVSAGVLALAFGSDAPPSALPAKISLGLAVVLSLFFLDLQGGGVEAEREDNGAHFVRLQSFHAVALLILKNFIYWLFLFGLSNIVLAAGSS